MSSYTLSKSEVNQFVNDATRKVQYKKVDHSFRAVKGLSKQSCSNCGLLLLNNDFTRWSVKMGCLSSYHPSYEAARKRTSK